jgi:hypothetical protein
MVMSGQYPMNPVGKMVRLFLKFSYTKTRMIFVLVVRKADFIRHQLLSNCATIRDCRIAAERLRQFFLEHPISSKSYEDSIENNANQDDDEASIFKWG